MLAFFERLLQPFPADEPTRPPASLVAFCRHYTRGATGLLLAVAALSAVVAVLVIALFSFLGVLLDWLTNTEPDQLRGKYGSQLPVMSELVLVALPIIVFFHSVLIHQSLAGNYPMAIRWQAHRYLLGQSVSFFQNEFAGRIATKVMQTALAVRETVMRLLDIAVYILVYFTCMIIQIGRAH